MNLFDLEILTELSDLDAALCGGQSITTTTPTLRITDGEIVSSVDGVPIATWDLSKPFCVILPPN